MTADPLPYDVPLRIRAFQAVGTGRAVAAIVAVSGVAFGFLVWLIYLKQPAGVRSQLVANLPAVNAGLNSLSTVFLLGGIVAVVRRRFAAHMRFMFAAFVSSTLFLVCYVVYHNAHGDTHFRGVGPVRPVYFTVLTSHIVLSAVALPLILVSFFLSLSGRYAWHRRVSRVTFPIWLYVSVTGVVVFAMLRWAPH